MTEPIGSMTFSQFYDSNRKGAQLVLGHRCDLTSVEMIVTVRKYYSAGELVKLL